jgi:hypothetical protein
MPVSSFLLSRGLALSGLALLLAGCGSSFTESGQLSLLDPNQPRDPAPVITITSAGLSPPVVHASPGVPTKFVNNDTVSHRLVGDPALGYGDCPEMAALPVLAPGQTGSVDVARINVICAFEDAAAPTNRAFQGLLVSH